MIRVLLVDDHPMIGAALEMLLRGTDYDLLGRARTVAEAQLQVRRFLPDLLLLDVNLPDGSGLDLLDRIARSRDRPRVILLTAGMEDAQLMTADTIQPEGMVLKTSDPGLLLECMDAVAGGERWIDPEIAQLLEQARHRASTKPSLTPRERDLVDLVRQGKRNRDIAETLGVTEGTVKVYLHGIFDKCGVANRTELAMRAADLVGH